jgi:hypothetical protein
MAPIDAGNFSAGIEEYIGKDTGLGCQFRGVLLDVIPYQDNVKTPSLISRNKVFWMLVYNCHNPYMQAIEHFHFTVFGLYSC